MKRRTFLQAGVAAVGATATATVSASAADPPEGEVYELNSCSALPGKQAVLDEYFERALVPAWKRAGAGPIGVFSETGGKDGSRTFVLVVHLSANHVLAARAKLASDRDYFNAAKDYLAVHPTEKVHGRTESLLLRPIAGMPRLEKPDASKPRVLNLRTYRSHNW
ncbi:MAG TPA: NIPSNAP family protein, partial [Gemmataceae bacterium]|nr:NIPSNAP family protein [Gemmataceae bacterium]